MRGCFAIGTAEAGGTPGLGIVAASASRAVKRGLPLVSGANVGRYNVTSTNGAATANAGLPDYAVWPTISFTAVSIATLESWRLFHFGLTNDTGIAADGYDAKADGEGNLLEFATDQSPLANTRVGTTLAVAGGILEFRSLRSNAATGEGVQYLVEWSDSLLIGICTSAGVIDVVDPENPETGDAQNRDVTIPSADIAQCFVRLRVTR